MPKPDKPINFDVVADVADHAAKSALDRMMNILDLLGSHEERAVAMLQVGYGFSAVAASAMEVLLAPTREAEESESVDYGGVSALFVYSRMMNKTLCLSTADHILWALEKFQELNGRIPPVDPRFVTLARTARSSR